MLAVQTRGGAARAKGQAAGVPGRGGEGLRDQASGSVTSGSHSYRWRSGRRPEASLPRCLGLLGLHFPSRRRSPRPRWKPWQRLHAPQAPTTNAARARGDATSGIDFRRPPTAGASPTRSRGAEPRAERPRALRGRSRLGPRFQGRPHLPRPAGLRLAQPRATRGLRVIASLAPEDAGAPGAPGCEAGGGARSAGQRSFGQWGFLRKSPPAVTPCAG